MASFTPQQYSAFLSATVSLSAVMPHDQLLEPGDSCRQRYASPGGGGSCGGAAFSSAVALPVLQHQPCCRASTPQPSFQSPMGAMLAQGPANKLVLPHSHHSWACPCMRVPRSHN